VPRLAVNLAFILLLTSPQTLILWKYWAIMNYP
jgi:hypothetical protein